jgi:Fe-S oxidoreductase
VAEALDLCLSCKGCKRDCPVGVDMAAYKTEFLAQRYAGRRRPRSHYAMGALPRWLRAAALVPGVAAVANAAARVPALAALAKKAGGIDPRRDIPPLAARTFRRGSGGSRLPSGERRRFWRRPQRLLDADGASTRGPGRRVVLWPDTFTDHFDPGVGHDAVAVLEALGYRVELPDKPVCCGLTWYSTGQVDTARRVLRRSLAVLRPWLDAGVSVVGLEPSCLATLRADATELLPDDPAAQALSGSVRTFAELLAEHADELRERVSAAGTAGAAGAGTAGAAGVAATRALVQLHCHQHADLGADADRTVLAALGVDAEVLDSGCCGLAGNWGFEEGHYDVSMACAERVLLPAVRDVAPGTAVLADGFSCRTQLRQAGLEGPGAEPLHLAQLAARALGVDAPTRGAARA